MLAADHISSAPPRAAIRRSDRINWRRPVLIGHFRAHFSGLPYFPQLGPADFSVARLAASILRLTRPPRWRVPPLPVRKEHAAPRQLRRILRMQFSAKCFSEASKSARAGRGQLPLARFVRRIIPSSFSDHPQKLGIGIIRPGIKMSRGLFVGSRDEAEKARVR